MTSTSEVTLDNPILETLIIQNLRNANYTLDLSRCPELTTINAKGSGFTGYVFANGGKLTTAVIEKPTALVLKNLNLLSNTNLTIRDYSRLTNLQIENCKLLDELTILNTATALDTVRLVGLDWYNSTGHLYELTSKDILDRLLLLKGIDHNGYILPQSYLSGRIDLNPESRIKKEFIESYREAWEPDLTLNIDENKIIPQYKISFYDADGTTRLSEYDYYLDQIGIVYDPVAGDGTHEAKEPPVKPMSESETYIFGTQTGNNYVAYSGWMRFNPNNHTDISVMQGTTVDQDCYYRAIYTAVPRQYTVKWFAGGADPVDTQSIAYGSEAVTSYIPANSYNTSTTVARTFKGWDKSSGYITGDLNINALFDEGLLPTKEELLANGLNSLTPA